MSPLGKNPSKWRWQYTGSKFHYETVYEVRKEGMDVTLIMQILLYSSHEFLSSSRKYI